MQPTQEQWLPVPGFEGLYEVSDQGRVRSVERFVHSERWNGPRRIRGRILKPWLSPTGYWTVSLWRADVGWKERIHVIVLLAFHGPRADSATVVRHLDGDKLNNALANLRWGTQSENVRDCVNHGNHHYAKRSHCKNGHEFTPENTYPREGNGRGCITCRSLRHARVRAAKRAARLAA